jgi:CHAD domain-containing protein
MTANNIKPKKAPEIPFPEPRPRVGILPEDPMAEAGRKVLLYHFAEMLRHEEGTRLGEDIEELHDMRVATRRMRAAFEVFGDYFEPKAIKLHLRGSRATGRALGRVRDLDVFMEKARRFMDAQPEDQRAGLDPLLVAWQAGREQARQAMLQHLDSQEYKTFKHKFNRFLQTPGAGVLRPQARSVEPNRVLEIAPGLIYSRLAAVRAYDAILENASLEQLHALRIEFKKLRYAVEYFREVLGLEAKEVIDDLKKMQDHLGDLNDANVATQILQEFLEEWEPGQALLPLNERQNAEPIVAYLAARHAERHQLIVTFSSVWAHFNREEFRRKLALAVSVL